MKSGIICVTYNNWDKLNITLKSIYKYTKSDYHLYLIDNGSKDRTKELYNHKLDNTTIIRNNQNMYWVGGINQGISLIRDNGNFDYTFFINDDIEVYDGWDLNHIKALEENKDLGAVGPLTSNLRDWQGYNSDCIRNTLKLNLPELYTDDLKEINEKIKNSDRKVYKVKGMLAFFATCFRTNIFDEIGILDKDFTEVMCGDDDDFCKRIQKKGYLLGLLLNTYVCHYAGSSVNKVNNDLRKWQKDEGRRLLREKHQ